MENILVRSSLRRSIRRMFRTSCVALGLIDNQELGNRVLDLSPKGMLVSCEKFVELGEKVFVMFRAPGKDGLWLDAEAEVSRIIHGSRANDFGYGMGLNFTYFDRIDQKELLHRLIGFPPPIPRRRPKVDYAATIRRISCTSS